MEQEDDIKQFIRDNQVHFANMRLCTLRYLEGYVFDYSDSTDIEATKKNNRRMWKEASEVVYRLLEMAGVEYP